MIARRPAFCSALGALLLVLPVSLVVAGPLPGGMGKKEEPKNTPKQGFTVAPNELSEFVLDAKSKRNQVVFISKAPKETIKGTTRTVAGQLKGNLYSLTDIAGSFEVAWKDLDTGNKTRNEHMMASPWVDATSHPKIVFTLTSIEPDEKQSKSGKILKGTLLGKMAMNGREREMSVPATLAYLPAKTSKSGKKTAPRMSIKAKFDVDLASYDIGRDRTGDKVAQNQNINVSLVMRQAKKEESKTAAGDKKKTKKKKKADSEA